MIKFNDVAKGLKLPLYFTSISPILIAWSFNLFKNYFLFILMVVIVFFMQAALNLSMDYFDNLNNLSVKNEDTLFPVGPYLIKNMNVKPEYLKKAFLISLIISIIAGIFLIMFTGKYILILIGFLAVFVSLIYVLPPFKLDARGLGEISTFFSFGIFSLIGAFIVFSEIINIKIILIAILLGFLASAIRFLHHITEDKKESNRVKNFKLIYVLILFSGFIIQLYNIKLFIFLIPAIIISILHFITIKGNQLKISRKTNEIVIIQIISTILIIMYFLL